MTIRPSEELARLRELLAALESRAMTIGEHGEDVTQREIDKLKPDIEYLESVLKRVAEEK